jgi:rhamnogalacturonan endolyase
MTMTGRFLDVVAMAGLTFALPSSMLVLAAPPERQMETLTTTTPTEHRLYTLMHDPQYRLAIAWQNVVYNKPPHPSFFLGDGMTSPPRPGIQLVGSGEAIAGVKTN